MEEKLLNSSLQQIFEMVREIVWKELKLDQAGLMLGLSDMGSAPHRYIGAYYSPNANMIVINKRPLSIIRATRPDLYKYYVFHILMHEYIHSIGVYDENETRQLVLELCKDVFGVEHPITQMSLDMIKLFPELTNQGFSRGENNIEFVPGIDKKGTNYIM